VRNKQTNKQTNKKNSTQSYLTVVTVSNGLLLVLRLDFNQIYIEGLCILPSYLIFLSQNILFLLSISFPLLCSYSYCSLENIKTKFLSLEVV